jgi:hypothetical protein
MTDMYDEALIAAIRRGVAEELEARARIGEKQHFEHHVWAEEQIKAERKRAELYERVLQHVLGWGAVIGIGWLGKVIFDAIVAVKGGNGG